MKTCVSCGRTVSEQEVQRYDDELADWMRRHPDSAAELVDATTERPGGIVLDCDKCAVDRLRRQKRVSVKKVRRLRKRSHRLREQVEAEANKTFMQRLIEGRQDACWIAIGIFILIGMILKLMS